MIPLPRFLTSLMLLLCLSLSVTGCGVSPPVRLYVLSPVRQAMTGPAPVFPPGTVIAIGPVTIPDYLDRPQVVITRTDNRIQAGEFDRWAGSLSSEVTRTISEDLSAILGGNVSVASWRRHIPFTARIAVEIIRFDIVSGQVRLKAQWTLYGRDGKQFLGMRESVVDEPVTGGDVASGVAAMSRALYTLSREVAAGLMSITLADPEQNRDKR
jgi:uncharacterized lipoprotein YmbA